MFCTFKSSSSSQRRCLAERSFGHACFRLAKVGWLIASFLLLALSSLTLAASSVTLAWDPNPEPDIVGYRLHYGISSGQFTGTIEAGNTTTATVTNLTAGSTWFFVVTAFNNAGFESPHSNEVSFTVPVTPPPAVISSLARGNDGTVHLTLTAPDPLAGPVGAVSVYFSDDLVSWTWLKDIPFTSGATVVDDPGAGSVNRRFYRLSFQQTSPTLGAKGSRHSGAGFKRSSTRR